jgi:anaerobic dimethyl sulfoxide reductase subunit B (iron-sulfur subunit)
LRERQGVVMRKQYGFYFNADRCVQCHACELACKSWNGVESGIRWREVLDAWSGQFPDVANRTVSFSCAHCEKPACADACPEKAISKRMEDGIVVVDADKCTGCRTCRSACPFGIPQYGKTGKMQKCDLCLERLARGAEPSCVATCPGEALQFGTMESLVERASLKSAERLAATTFPCLVVSGRLTGSVILKMLDERGSRRPA